MPLITYPPLADTAYVLAGHALPLYDIRLLVTDAHPVIVFAGALYRHVVVALRGDTELYVPPVGDAPLNALHALQLLAPALL